MKPSGDTDAKKKKIDSEHSHPLAETSAWTLSKVLLTDNNHWCEKWLTESIEHEIWGIQCDSDQITFEKDGNTVHIFNIYTMPKDNLLE